MFSIFDTEAKLVKDAQLIFTDPFPTYPLTWQQERERAFYKMDPNQAMEGDSPVAPEVT